MTLDCSLGETEALVVRATRGAGLSWGQAHEAGRAVIRLAVMGLPSVIWLASILPKIQTTHYERRCPGDPFDFGRPDADTACSVGETGLCPIALGCGLADTLPMNAGATDPIVLRFKAVWSPALIAGLVLPVANRLGRIIRLNFNQTELVIMHGQAYFNGDPQSVVLEHTQHVLMTFERSNDFEYVPIQTAGCSFAIVRCAIDAHIYEQLQTYAHKTYVPSTAAAHADGAGAGLTDND